MNNIAKILRELEAAIVIEGNLTGFRPVLRTLFQLTRQMARLLK